MVNVGEPATILILINRDFTRTVTKDKIIDEFNGLSSIGGRLSPLYTLDNFMRVRVEMAMAFGAKRGQCTHSAIAWGSITNNRDGAGAALSTKGNDHISTYIN